MDLEDTRGIMFNESLRDHEVLDNSIHECRICDNQLSLNNWIYDKYYDRVDSFEAEKKADKKLHQEICEVK